MDHFNAQSWLIFKSDESTQAASCGARLVNEMEGRRLRFKSFFFKRAAQLLRDIDASLDPDQRVAIERLAERLSRRPPTESELEKEVAQLVARIEYGLIEVHVQ